MGNLWSQLFSTDDFPARWQCGNWTDLHGWVHISADAAIFGAYFAIPVVLTYFAIKRRDVPFLPIFWLFGAFILACGTGHLVEAAIFWHPWYRLSGAVKVATALISWVTVVALVRVLPKALELPGVVKLNQELVRENEERRRVEAALRESEARKQVALDESKMLLQEIHHRVKNNLQVVSSLLRLQAGKLRGTAETEVFTECRERIRAMALIHERLYATGQFAAIEFGGYIAEMARMILGANTETGSRVRLDLQLDKIEVNIETAVPLSLIASELVLNALKHAFNHERAGTLTIKLREGVTTHELIVQDDGPGLPNSATPHTAPPGIGFELVESLTRQIRGERHCQTGPTGTTISIRWPAHAPIVKQVSPLVAASLN